MACRPRALWIVVTVALPATGAAAAPTVGLAPSLPPLAMLPSIARVGVTSHGGAVAIIEDVNLPRGDWKGEALRFHVAFGAPGPRALDARLVPVADGALEADPDESGEVLPTDRVPRRPPNAYPLLGRDTMAGIVVTVRPDAMTRALARGNMATLRIRSVADATEPDATGAISLVVRLGVSRGTPLTLGRLVASASGSASSSASAGTPVVRAEARLCGPDADAQPLAVAIVSRGAVQPRPPAPASGSPIAPVLAVRHATDDLCLRLWPGAT